MTRRDRQLCLTLTGNYVFGDRLRRLPAWDNLDYRINFFAAGFIDTIHTWLRKKDRTPEQMAKFLLEMLVQLRS